jgi:hypothetical protein
MLPFPDCSSQPSGAFLAEMTYRLVIVCADNLINSRCTFSDVLLPDFNVRKGSSICRGTCLLMEGVLE